MKSRAWCNSDEVAASHEAGHAVMMKINGYEVPIRIFVGAEAAGTAAAWPKTYPDQGITWA